MNIVFWELLKNSMYISFYLQKDDINITANWHQARNKMESYFTHA